MQPGVFNSLFIIWLGDMIDLWFVEIGIWEAIQILTKL
jgi:hypothetical protein